MRIRKRIRGCLFKTTKQKPKGRGEPRPFLIANIMKNADKPINPFTAHFDGQEIAIEHQNNNSRMQLGGLTKREYFAGLAMQGLLKTKSVVVAAKMAVSSADALLEELEKTQR